MEYFHRLHEATVEIYYLFCKHRSRGERVRAVAAERLELQIDSKPFAR